MATNSTKPPDDSPTNETKILKTRSTCSCSNISIMQLFHEMKQKFPTVPDHVVSELVTQHCHNKPVCLSHLEKAVLGHPVAAQSYPAQSIHSNSSSLKRKINEKKLSKLESLCSSSDSLSSRENSVDTKSEINNNNHNLINFNNNINKISDMSLDNNSVNHFNINPNNRVANRPNTLAISNVGMGQHFIRPTRTAPPPPINSSVTASPNLGESLNVSLNVTVSPVTNSPRHTSTLSVQPEPPYTRDNNTYNNNSNNNSNNNNSNNNNSNNNSNNNNRSSTSVNLTLRQPSSSPQSPINVIASPRLTYSSRTYDAKAGYESKLEIIVGEDGFRSFTALRTQAPNHHNMDNYHRGELDGAGNHRLGNNALGHSIPIEETTVSLQLEQRQRLSDEVVQNRQALETLQMEIKVLKEPLAAEDVNLLHNEIYELRNECLRMTKEYDEGDSSVNDTRFLNNMNSLAVNDNPSDMARPTTSNRPPRPPRPPLPRRLNQVPPPNPSYTNEEQSSDNNNGLQWSCHMCTFRNHELMTKCEQCDMPKISGTHSAYRQPQLENVQLLHSAPPSLPNNNNNNYRPMNGFTTAPDAIAAANPILAPINPNNNHNNNSNPVSILDTVPILCMNPTSQTPVPTNGLHSQFTS